ncbi:MAG: hypothetical protein HY650_06240 [Acidobacteria bacterium]|nr:hypothetical protein [Acidobacteriota bacterium]
MNFSTFLRLLGRHWWLMILTPGLVFGATAYFTHKQRPTYRAVATVIVGPNEKLARVDEIAGSLNTLDRRSVVATYARIPSSRTVRERAREDLGLQRHEISPYDVRTTIVPDTNVVEISVEGPDARLATAVANAVVEQAKDYVQEFYGIFGLKLLDRASQPSRPVRPVMSRNLSVGAVFGLLMGVSLTLLYDYIRRARSITAESAVPEPATEPEVESEWTA